MKLLYGLYLIWVNCSILCWENFVEGVIVFFKVREIDNDNLFVVINENRFYLMKYGNKILKLEIVWLFWFWCELVLKRE